MNGKRPPKSPPNRVFCVRSSAFSKNSLHKPLSSEANWMSSLSKKAMFNALTEKDVNGVYVILSQRDYNKMIQD